MDKLLTEEEVQKRAYNLTVSNTVGMSLQAILYISTEYEKHSEDLWRLAEAKIQLQEDIKIYQAWQKLSKKRTNGERFFGFVESKIYMCQTALDILNRRSLKTIRFDETERLAWINETIKKYQGGASRREQYRLHLFQEMKILLTQNPI